LKEPVRGRRRSRRRLDRLQRFQHASGWTQRIFPCKRVGAFAEGLGVIGETLAIDRSRAVFGQLVSRQQDLPAVLRAPYDPAGGCPITFRLYCRAQDSERLTGPHRLALHRPTA
jgi:hypothetical protein